MRVLVFGVGEYYRKHKEDLFQLPDTEIVGFLDNNKKLWKAQIDRRRIYAPDYGIQISHDKVLLMSLNTAEMEEQLLSLGEPVEKIVRYEEYIGMLHKGEMHVYYGQDLNIDKRKRVLAITTDIGCNGGTIAIVYALLALKKRGYFVALAAPAGNMEFIKEMHKEEFPIILYSNIKFEDCKGMNWIRQYDYIIVNTFQMYPCVLNLSSEGKIFWWLHESPEMYQHIFRQNRNPLGKGRLKCKVWAVSEIARNNFLQYFPDVDIKIMPYGIPDTNDFNKSTQGRKLIFALIGNVCKIKGQDIFIQAIKHLNAEMKEKAEFWIIGKIKDDEFGRKITDLALLEPSIRIYGEVCHKRMDELYREITVTVNASRQDTMSIVVTEGMMWRKACIVSNAAGIAEYLEEGKSGL